MVIVPISGDDTADTETTIGISDSICPFFAWVSKYAPIWVTCITETIVLSLKFILNIRFAAIAFAPNVVFYFLFFQS